MSEQSQSQKDWFYTDSGLQLIKAEKHLLNRWMKKQSVGVILQLAGVVDANWVEKENIKVLHVTQPGLTGQSDGKTVVADYSRLPLETESVDAVLLPHALTCQEKILPILQEACRVLKPNGQLIVLEMNKRGIWRLYKSQFDDKYFLSPTWLKTKLQRLCLDVVCLQTTYFRSPRQRKKRFQLTLFLEALGQLCFASRGAGFMLVAIKKVPGSTIIPVMDKIKKTEWKTAPLRQTTRDCHE